MYFADRPAVLDLEQEGHASQDPLGGLLLGLEVEGPHIGGAAGLGLVDGALVDVPRLLPVYGDGLDEDDRHGRCQLFEAGLCDHTGLRVPARTLHEEAVHVGAFTRWAAHVVLVLLGDITLQAHLVEWPLVLTGHLLHDGGEEGLRVEEASQPDGRGQLEVSYPGLELLYTQKQI